MTNATAQKKSIKNCGVDFVQPYFPQLYLACSPNNLLNNNSQEGESKKNFIMQFCVESLYIVLVITSIIHFIFYSIS